MKKLMILCILCILTVIGNLLPANSELPKEAYYKNMVFKEKDFGYKDKKIIYPPKNSARCIAVIENKSFRCQGSKFVTVTDISEGNFEVAATYESTSESYHTTMKDSLIEAQNICSYEAEFLPLSKYQYHNLKKLSCNVITKDICEVIFDVYHAVDVDTKETTVDKDLFKRFMDIVKSDELQAIQKKSSAKSYASIFNTLNSKYGKGKSSSHKYPDGFDRLDKAISANKYSVEYTSLLDLIEGQSISNFKELKSFLNSKANDLAYFDNNYISACYGPIQVEFFNDQTKFSKTNNKKKTSAK